MSQFIEVQFYFTIKVYTYLLRYKCGPNVLSWLINVGHMRKIPTAVQGN